jgi:hypothetical protein
VFWQKTDAPAIGKLVAESIILPEEVNSCCANKEKEEQVKRKKNSFFIATADFVILGFCDFPIFLFPKEITKLKNILTQTFYQIKNVAGLYVL